MVKKGYIRTLEAFFAVFATVIFIIIIFPESSRDLAKEPEVDLLGILSQDNDFRSCILSENHTCVDVYIKAGIDYGYYNYTFNISSDYSSSARINRDNVFLKSSKVGKVLSMYDETGSS